MRKRLAAIGVATILATAAAWADWSDTSAGIEITQLPAFPLTKVRSGLLQNAEDVHFDGLVARMIGPTGAIGEVSLEGAAKAGKRWAVRFSWISFNEVYRGDLDGNRTQDYIVFGSTGNMLRLTRPRGAIVLLMDTQGLPVPFKAGLFDQWGPEHVVGLKHNGRAPRFCGKYARRGTLGQPVWFRLLRPLGDGSLRADRPQLARLSRQRR